MIHTKTGVATSAALLTIVILVVATPARAQAPSEAQREAVKSECRNDYIAHCSSIPPGGAAALECLQKNMASLSAGCASAVKAVEAPSETKTEPAREETKQGTTQETKTEPKTEPAPAATTAKPAAEPAAKAASAPKQPTSAQVSAIRSNCRSDYPKVCAGVPTGGAPALQCLEKNEAKLSASCKKAVMAASGGGSAAPAATSGGAPAAAGAAPAAAAAPTAEPAPVLVLRPMRPREVLFVMRSACGEDVRLLCPGVAPGGGRIIECLVGQSAKLSPACRSVLGQFAQ
jgi:Cysteine rich repeat